MASQEKRAGWGGAPSLTIVHFNVIHWSLSLRCWALKSLRVCNAPSRVESTSCWAANNKSSIHFFDYSITIFGLVSYVCCFLDVICFICICICYENQENWDLHHVKVENKRKIGNDTFYKPRHDFLRHLNLKKKTNGYLLGFHLVILCT